MTKIRCICLPNPAPVCSTYIAIHFRDDPNEWDITSVELYADAECKKLLADFTIDELPRDTQEAIYAALLTRFERRRDAGRPHPIFERAMAPFVKSLVATP